MELWATGEVQLDVYLPFCRSLKVVVSKINSHIRRRDYGPGLKEWAFIAIIRAIDSPDYDEIAKYSKRRREVEFRLKIDQVKFRGADRLAQECLLFKALVRSVKMMIKIGVKDVAVHELLKDVTAVGKTNEWI